MISKFLWKYVKSIGSITDSAYSEHEKKPVEEYVPTLLLCGSSESGKSRIFGRLIATQTDIPDRIGSRMRSDSSEKEVELNLMSGSEDDDESIASTQDVTKYQKVKHHMHSICNTRSKILEIPEDARGDASYFLSREGSICYVILLDSFDQYLEDDESGISLLEQEIENVILLASLRRSSDTRSFTILLTKTEEFEKKMQNPENVAKLPSCLQPRATKVQSRKSKKTTTLSENVAQALCSHVQKVNRYSTVFSYVVSDLDHACITVSSIVKALYVKNELTASGFLG